MQTLKYGGLSYTVDHAVKGVDYIHGYNADGQRIVAFDGVTDFSDFEYTGTYLAPDKCLEEGCNVVKHVDGRLLRGDGKMLSKAGVGAGKATGVYSFAAGTSKASGTLSASFNSGEASGDNSFAAGINTRALGYASHAEGGDYPGDPDASIFPDSTDAYGDFSHAEGYITKAEGFAAHAEGANNVSLSRAGHAEGSNNQIGSKAFTILAVDPVNKTYTLDSTTGLQEAVDNGYLYSCHVCFYKTSTREHSSMQKENYGKITAINGNVVTVDPFYDVTAEVTDGVFETKSSYIVDDMDTEENTFRVVDLPNVGTRTIGDSAHVEGDQCKTLSKDAHAEGFMTLAYGSYAHVEGNRTKAGFGGHAEGRETTASGKRAHAEGFQTTASGEQSHSEGWRTASKGKNSHAEGFETVASGEQSHAEGKGSVAQGYSSHAENNGKAYGANSHAEGSGAMAYGKGSHAEGEVTQAKGDFSHAEGGKAVTTGLSRQNTYGTLPTRETISISSNIAEGTRSHAEGEGTHAYGRGSHAEGLYTYAGGYNSHAEGQLTQALSSGCHAEGWDTVAKGGNSHAEGNCTAAIGAYSHAEGQGTVVHASAGHAQGRYNKEDTAGKYAHIVGNGSSANSRSNAHTIDWDGNAWYKGDAYVGGQDQASGSKLATEKHVKEQLESYFEYGTELPAAGTKGRIFFKVVG